MTNTNSKNLENCYSCNSCYYCNSCNYCNYCNFCDNCEYCESCYNCKSCNYCNSCDYCVGLRMSEKMIFCLGEGKYESKGAGYQKSLQIFNTPVSEDEYNKTKSALSVKNFKPPMITQKQPCGHIRVLSYKDAWKKMWNELSNEDKNFFFTLPHFNAEIFEKITGINPEIKTLSGKEVEVKLDGVTYKAIIQ